MKERDIIEENDVKDTLPEDLHIQKASVPGGWIYIAYVQRKEGSKICTTQLSTVYVPGRR